MNLMDENCKHASYFLVFQLCHQNLAVYDIHLGVVEVHDQISWDRERSGSVVECLTGDLRAAGSSLTGLTALWSLSKTHLS